MSAKEENYQGFIVSDHPLGEIHIHIYADKVVVKLVNEDDPMKCTVPLNHGSLHKLTALEEECATNTSH